MTQTIRRHEETVQGLVDRRREHLPLMARTERFIRGVARRVGSQVDELPGRKHVGATFRGGYHDQYGNKTQYHYVELPPEPITIDGYTVTGITSHTYFKR